MDMTKVGAENVASGGYNWDEKGRDQAVGIYVYYNNHTVIALQFLFYENGNLVKSNRHGLSETAYSYAAVIFDYPSENVASVSGSVNIQYMSTIKFGTNKGSYGPFGTPSGDDGCFNLHIGIRGLFGGFYGRANGFGIESIGVYMKNITSSMINLKDPKVKDEKEED